LRRLFAAVSRGLVQARPTHGGDGIGLIHLLVRTPGLDRAIAVRRQAGLRTIRLRGNTNFSQTEHREQVTFVFGMDAASAALMLLFKG
jgi:hypothetical protein